MNPTRSANRTETSRSSATTVEDAVVAGSAVSYRLIAAMQLDHVLIAVTDLTAAAMLLELMYELESIEGGRHPGWGTANRIIPLGDSYLELVAVVDQSVAAKTAFGQWVGRAATPDGHLLGWAVHTDDIDEASRRLGLTPHSGSRVGKDGNSLRWRTAGVEQAVTDPALPFFIEWAPGSVVPGHAGRHPRWSISQLVVRGDSERLMSWLGDNSLPISVVAGPSAIIALVLDGPHGQIVIDSTTQQAPLVHAPEAESSSA